MDADYPNTGVNFACRFTSLDAHLRDLSVETQDDVFAVAGIGAAQIFEESERLEHRVAEIKVDALSDVLVSLIVRDGEIIDVVQDGAPMSWFDTDPEAHRSKWRALIDHDLLSAVVEG